MRILGGPDVPEIETISPQGRDFGPGERIPLVGTCPDESHLFEHARRLVVVREHDRVDYDAQVTLYAEFEEADQEKSYLVRTRNISSSGLGFIHHSEVVAGTRVCFTAFDNDGRVCSLEGVSARADLIEEGLWDIGIRFDHLIDLTHLLDMDGQPLLQSA
ncbi:MAG: PilZ domain-containing protein [Planctomycetota bacterium]